MNHPKLTFKEMDKNRSEHDDIYKRLVDWYVKEEERVFRSFIHNIQIELLRYNKIKHYYFLESDEELVNAIIEEKISF